MIFPQSFSDSAYKDTSNFMPGPLKAAVDELNKEASRFMIYVKHIHDIE